MRSFLSILIAGIFLSSLTGCNRRGSDPLEWRVRGRTPELLEIWVNESIERMPTELGKEYSAAVVTILNLTPRPPTQKRDDSSDPLCRRLDGHSVREIIIEADELEVNELRNRISLEYSNLTRLMQYPNLTAEQTASLERRQKRTEAFIKGLEEQIARKNARIAELTVKN